MIAILVILWNLLEKRSAADERLACLDRVPAQTSPVRKGLLAARLAYFPATHSNSHAMFSPSVRMVFSPSSSFSTSPLSRPMPTFQ